MSYGDPMTFAHFVSGPLDLIVELGLPLAVFAGLYWWTTRKRGTTKK